MNNQDLTLEEMKLLEQQAIKQTEEELYSQLVSDSNSEEEQEICNRLTQGFYEPSQSMEWYDYVTNIYYSGNPDIFSSLRQLRNPEEYISNSEGYTPFGDE